MESGSAQHSGTISVLASTGLTQTLVGITISKVRTGKSRENYLCFTLHVILSETFQSFSFPDIVFTRFFRFPKPSPKTIDFVHLTLHWQLNAIFVYNKRRDVYVTE